MPTINIKAPIQKLSNIGVKRKKYSQKKVISADKFLSIKLPMTTRNKDMNHFNDADPSQGST